jgi:hypothetical protein
MDDTAAGRQADRKTEGAVRAAPAQTVVNDVLS